MTLPCAWSRCLRTNKVPHTGPGTLLAFCTRSEELGLRGKLQSWPWNLEVSQARQRLSADIGNMEMRILSLLYHIYMTYINYFIVILSSLLNR
jgi:hypothetical protein